jgi:hypothetical protein
LEKELILRRHETIYGVGGSGAIIVALDMRENVAISWSANPDSTRPGRVLVCYNLVGALPREASEALK